MGLRTQKPGASVVAPAMVWTPCACFAQFVFVCSHGTPNSITGSERQVEGREKGEEGGSYHREGRKDRMKEGRG